MGQIANLSDLINRSTSVGEGDAYPETLWVFKDNTSGGLALVTVAGRWTTMVQTNGYNGNGSATTANPQNSNAGSFYQAEPWATKWIVSANFNSSQPGTLVIVDRLAAESGLSGTTTTPQTFSIAVNRYTGAESAGNQIWLEILTQIGATPTTVTVEYTNQAGTQNRVTQAVDIGGTGLREINRAIPCPLQSGDTGVRSIENIDLLASTGTAGNIVATIQRPLLTIPISTNGVGSLLDLMSGLPGPIEIKTNSYLTYLWLANGTTPPRLYGNIQTVNA